MSFKSEVHEIFVDKKVNEHIQEDIEINLEDQDLWARKGIIWQHLKESIHFGSESANENVQPTEEKAEKTEKSESLPEPSTDSDISGSPDKSKPPETTKLPKSADPKPEAAE